ncbi:YlxM family DNA-binding protein [Mesoplasma seiffertii]|uniref:YlxM family DNA-binding protein n=1 Tax=Mesoplasma seiffertii TaxID=28224 RepID=UPI0004788F26|nr:sigma factor-like helix-turn-helix DNA-binding protein [Mesoplasma seiffertii]
MTNGLNNKVEVSMLFRLYKNLLTPKQVEYFELYNEEDLSLQEIASELNVSRAAVHDSITKTTKLLYEFEEKLKLQQQADIIQEIVKSAKQSNNEEVKQIIEKLEKILEWIY